MRAWVRFVLALAWYGVRRKTPRWGYLAMRRVHLQTDGRVNDRWRALQRRFRPYRGHSVNGILGHWTEQDVRAVAAEVERNGWVVLPRVVPEDVCAHIERHARVTPAIALGHRGTTLYSSNTADALRYDFASDDILRDETARALALDDTFRAIAGAYFGSRPTFDFVTMWWTTAKGERDLSGAAQLFHYDMDRLCFLKFFVYLTDVTPDAGPHVFVAGSHRRKPATLRQDRRFDDDEIAACYPPERIVEICGPRGTVFAADTRGLHKGAPVRHGERLVLQVEYATDLFGQTYAEPR